MTGAIDAPDGVRAMFDRIAPRYDLMNRLMTGWQDARWRRIAAEIAVDGGAATALDAATGTGGLARALHRAGAHRVVGVDVSSAMLDRAAVLSSEIEGIELSYADVMDLPFDDGTFDACTIGFGLRNLPDYQLGIRELTRVLAPGGRLVILELSPVSSRVFGTLFGLYFGKAVPVAGWLVTGDRDAYRYLPESVQAFPDAPGLAAMMNGAGLCDVRWRYFGRRTVALHVGRKSNEEPDE